jgi:galactose oxidase
MHYARRQHNATLLPDGSVLVTGGTQGGTFNNLEPGNPVHVAELWDPVCRNWTLMALESVDRCYHSTAVLLPDGRVLSGGGGEWAPEANQSNDPIHTHSNAQLFSPPYLFKGARPVIVEAPDLVSYGQTFRVETATPGDIDQVTLIRLSSVTHSFNQNQRINFLAFSVDACCLAVTAPPNANVCPPGHYLLFILNKNKVPSEASIVQIVAPAVASSVAPSTAMMRASLAPKRTLTEKCDAIRAQEQSSPVVVGVTPTCPYGLGACWAGAFDALKQLSGVRLVLPVPDIGDSIAFVYLEHDGLPSIDLWPDEFANTAKGGHLYRGVEITVTGEVKSEAGGDLVLAAAGLRPQVILQPIQPGENIQWDLSTRALKPLTADEQNAFASLQAQVDAAGGSLAVTVTGPLSHPDPHYRIKVREIG